MRHESLIVRVLSPSMSTSAVVMGEYLIPDVGSVFRGVAVKFTVQCDATVATRSVYLTVIMRSGKDAAVSVLDMLLGTMVASETLTFQVRSGAAGEASSSWKMLPLPELYLSGGDILRVSLAGGPLTDVIGPLYLCFEAQQTGFGDLGEIVR